jgi:hypothetical protein
MTTKRSDDVSLEADMKARLDFRKASPEGDKAMTGLHMFVRIDMHAKELRADGESEQRLYLLSAWRDSPLYSDRERAALAWAEAVTLVADHGVSDEVYAQARKHFSERKLTDLTLALVAINGANRLNIAFPCPAAIG